jgi:hypothetical protein
MNSPTTKILALASVCLLLCLLLAGCAQTGAPLPPSLELPKPPSDLRAIRKGDRVTLTWSQPSLTTDRKSVRYIGPTMICRSLKAEISECGTPIEMLSAATTVPTPVSKSAMQKSASRPAPALQTYTDTLPPALQRPDASTEVTYAVEVLNRNARGAGLSNRVHVVAIPTLPPPGDLAVQLNDQGTVLSWTSAGAPPESADVQHRYRIYRGEEASGDAKPAKDVVAGEVPVGAPGPVRFTDSSFEWEKTYLYRITAVSIVKQSDHETQVEGDDTAPVRVVAHDIFPPAVPTWLQAAFSGEGQAPFVDLIWAPATNSDLAGYNIYRSDGDGNAVKLNADMVKSPSYRDTAVSSGKTYTYSVSAVDVRGNESQHSESTSEPVP